MMQGLNQSVDKDSNFYRGIVVDNNDPLKLGRVRVRIASMHGLDKTAVPDSDLPWSTLVSLGASYDAGCFIVPEVGSTVLVGFENGNHESPIVFGGVYSMGRQLGLTQSVSSSAYSNEGSEESQGRQVPSNSHDVPQLGRDDLAARILYRSPKGSEVFTYEGDGEEKVVVKDPNGQVFEMKSPMSAEATKDDKHKYNSDKKNNLSGKARILLSSAFGQFIKFVTDGVSGVLNFVDSITKTGMEIDSNDKYVRVFNQSGSKVELIATSDSIQLRTEGSFVKLSNGTIIVAGSDVLIEAPTVSIKGKISLQGTISVSGALNANGVDLIKHNHKGVHGMTSGPMGGPGNGPSPSAPTVEIKDWSSDD